MVGPLLQHHDWLNNLIVVGQCHSQLAEWALSIGWDQVSNPIIHNFCRTFRNNEHKKIMGYNYVVDNV